MKIKIEPEGPIRTTLPVTLYIKEVSSTPKVEVQGLGLIPVQSFKDHYRAQFWAQKPGSYTAYVLVGNETWSREFIIKEQTYLSFSKEFGAFLLFFSIVAGGGILWFKKHHQKV